MKYIVSSTLFLLIHCSLAAKEPTNLTKLRANWHTAKEEAIKPINQKYYTALLRLKEQYMKNGDLESAVAVNHEIKRNFPKTQTKSPPRDLSFRIVSATYGAGKKRVNVKNQLNQHIKDGKLSIYVNRKYLGDPTPYYKKSLHIKYISKGRSTQKSFHEGAKVQLP